jgi:predicted esterase YcpF (UPF0227 family)
MKILNLHGFMGEADNKNYKALCELVPIEDIVSPQLRYMETSPSELLSQLGGIAEKEEFILVGQSLGGWYADKLSRRLGSPCILTNPCYYPHELELITSSGIPADFTEQYRLLTDSSKNERAYTICSDGDTILPNNLESCIKLSCTVKRAHGSHSTIEDIGIHLSDMLKAIGLVG